MKIVGSGSGSFGQRHEPADPDPVPTCHGSTTPGKRRRRLPGRRAGSPCRPPETGSIGQRHGSADPDPWQNVTDPQHWVRHYLEGEQAAHADDPLLEGGAEHAPGPHDPCRDVEDGADQSAPHPAHHNLQSATRHSYIDIGTRVVVSNVVNGNTVPNQIWK
jgi:hypothetical protein